MADSLDELIAEADRWYRDHPWLSRLRGYRYRLRSAWVALRREPRHRWERARYGVSYKDAWGFDTFIAGVVARACDQIKDGHGYPVGMTPESWAEYLDGISGPLRHWQTAFADTMSYEDERAAYEAAVAAMHRFADRFGDMWD